MKRKLLVVLTLFWVVFLTVGNSKSWASVYTVDNTANTDNLAIYTLGDGTNTLRKCLRLCNAGAGLDSIYFNIPSAPYVIALPTSISFTAPVFINGFTQPGAAPGTPLIELSGTAAITILQFNAGSSGSTVAGLVIYGVGGTGIQLNNTGNHSIYGNYIGTNAAGMAAGSSPTIGTGISITGASASNNLIGGLGGINTRNIIAGIAGRGIFIQTNAFNTTIQGNFIGVNVTGNTALNNTNSAIESTTQGPLTVGGAGFASRNIIGGSADGIRTSACTSLVIKGNFIGIGNNGNAAITNTGTGVNLQTASSNVIIGGPTLAERNVIGSHNGSGILANSSPGIVIVNNYIGTDSTGLIGRANQVGINLTSCNNTVIGGTSVACRNLVCSSTQDAIRINNCNTVTIKGNFIGLGANGSTSLNNAGHGITLQGTTASVIIGGTSLPERNVIGSNNTNGINGTVNGITIVNNFIGTDSTGLLAKNNQSGISLSTATNVVIGGTAYNTRNILGGATQQGISVTNGTTVTIKGNFIALGADGATSMPIGQNGIQLGNPTSGVVIGGTTRQERNVIGVCGANGIQANTSPSILIVNNYIGSDSTGLLVRTITTTGIALTTCNNAVIGGTSFLTRNVIGSCNQQGISAVSTTGLTIKGNFIGLGADGIISKGIGQNGINLSNPTGAVLIGGTTLAERNIIGTCGANGIQANTSPDIQIVNNYLGSDSTGMLARTITTSGISLNTCSNAVIGGSVYATRNVIGSCNQQGINVVNSSNLIIRGNFIGLASDGTTARPVLQNGINLQNPTSAVFIGGVAKAERNIIASCSQNAIQGNTSAGITIYNNFLGTDSSGMIARGCGGSGINLTACSSVQIGGATYAMRNIISNSINNHGISLATCSTSVNIQGNFIGLAVDGNTAMGNRNNGIQVQTSSPVVIGGPTTIDRNIVGSNQANGIQVNNSAIVSIQNNYVGTDSTGMMVRGNTQVGITCSTISGGLIIGGSTYNLRNISASNGNNGITVSNAPGVIIRGNLIGFAVDAQTARGNGQHGITVSNSAGALIGGSLPAERNLVGNNTNQGIQLNTSSSSIVLNNYIGTDSTGMLVRGNGSVGLSASNSTNLIIGGSMFSAGNLIANNNSHGISLTGTSSQASIKGNIIGHAIDGTTIMGNRGHGIELSSSFKAIIGGSTVAERNLIGNSFNQGIQISNSDSVKIYGNYVGVDITGLLNRGNLNNGINVSGSRGVEVGSANYHDRNIVSGNAQSGIKFNGNCPGELVKGNFCGLGADGSTLISNQESGIHFGGSGSDGAIIGGSLYSERNVCSGNGTMVAFTVSRDGIRIDGGSSNHVIKGNFCGVDSTGTLPRGNVWAGISINECKNLIVGGTGPFEGNICSDNFHEGFYLRNDTNCTLIGNFVGTDRSATLDLGNHDYGINIRYRSYMNFIGGTSTAEANIIANTKNMTGIGSGVFIDSLGWRNRVVKNKIYCNAEKAIHLGNTANESILAPSVLSSDANTISGTGSLDGDSIHVYLNIKTGGYCDCEGEMYVGGTVVSGGTWSLTHNLNLTGGAENNLTATETTLLGSTSEFSDCYVPLPVQFLYLQAKKLSSNTAGIYWATASETNNHHFEVQRSSDGIHFETIGMVSGSGNSNTVLQYHFVDVSPETGENYYRILQVDYDGKSSYSEIESLNFGVEGISVLSMNQGFLIQVSKSGDEILQYKLYSVTGSMLLEGNVEVPAQGQVYVPVDLSEAVYVVSIFYGHEMVKKKIVVR